MLLTWVLSLLLTTVVLPKNEILVKGATAAASDSSTPLPEQGRVVENRYRNDYFGLSYALPAGWTEQPAGPPPSDTGSYVLTQFALIDPAQKRVKAHLLLTAQDLFFTTRPAANADELLRAFAKNLPPEYAAEHAPDDIPIAGRTFTRFRYGARAAGLHWRMLSAGVRCHALTFTFTGTDAAALDAAERAMQSMTIAANGAPACVADYASGANVIEKTDPQFSTHRFNTIPVRVIADANGNIRHVHVLSAFPEQSEAIFRALRSWKLRPYANGGKASEVETGLVFGLPRRTVR